MAAWLQKLGSLSTRPPRSMTDTSITIDPDAPENQQPLLCAVPSSSSLKARDPELNTEIDRFLDDAAKHKKVDLKEGFYVEDADDIPHHHVDERDVADHHRGAEYQHHHHILAPDHHHHHHHHHKHRHHDGKHKHRKKHHTADKEGEKLPTQPEEPEDTDLESLETEVKTSTPTESYVPVHDALDGKHVSFTIGADDTEGEPSSKPSAHDLTKGHDVSKEQDEASHKHFHRKRSTHIPSETEMAKRYYLGSEIQLHGLEKQISVNEAENEGLSSADLENIASHRGLEGFGYEGRHRHRMRPPTSTKKQITPGPRKGAKVSIPVSSLMKFDHSPHHMFVELDELHLGADEEYSWRERARWIKFEETVEEGADHFGKPHVSSLSFHSLLELRRCIEQGVVVLDLEKYDLPNIVTHIVDQMVLNDQLPGEEKGPVLKALLLKHTHVNDSKSHKFLSSLARPSSFSEKDSEKAKAMGNWPSTRMSLADVQTACKHGSSNTSLPTLGFENNRINGDIIEVNDNNDNNNTHTTHTRSSTSLDNGSVNGNQHGIKFSASRASFSRESHAILRRIPKGSEATAVLVGTVEFLQQPIMAFVRLSSGCYLGNLTEVPLPVRFLFILLGPPSDSLDYLEIGRSISTLMANTAFHDTAYKADDRADLLSAINEFLDDSIVLPPGDWDQELNKDTLKPTMDAARRKSKHVKHDKERKERKKSSVTGESPKIKEEEHDPLKRTGRFFGGLINDAKKRYPHYWSDIKDGINSQCIAAIFFIYFAALSPAITFGGLLNEVTEQWMGVSELLIGTCIFGLIFALFAAQPITIIGATGPILIFEQSLYSICGSIGVEYISFRFWVMMWLTIIIVIFVAFDGSVLVRLFSRFTQEIFAALISLIFIFETFNKLYKIFAAHPLQSIPEVNCTAMYLDSLYTASTNNASTTLAPDNSTGLTTEASYLESCTSTSGGTNLANQPNTALLSFLLTMATFIIAWLLKGFRNSKFLGRQARGALGDFGVPISILIMVVVDYCMKDVFTEKLYVPDGMSVTAACKRGWIINPMGMHEEIQIWAIFLAAVPGLLVFILIFMESEITMLIINKKERNLKKGTGYHLDLMLLGFCAIFAGLLGLPMVCAATVRSVSHVTALSVFSRTHAPGEKPKLVETKEQRITAFFVHVLIGISVLMGPILRQVPLAVLFGVFLYMGVASLSGIQFIDRLEMVFMPRKHHLDTAYVRHVRTWKMHMFTLIEFLCLAVLWAVKSTAAALAFPFILVLTVPLRRYGLKFFFNKSELHYLDKDTEEGGSKPQVENDESSDSDSDSDGDEIYHKNPVHY